MLSTQILSAGGRSMSERQLGDTILEVNNISLSFGVMKVLDNISFDIKK